MSAQIVQFGTEPPRVGEVEKAIGKLFAALEPAASTGIEYAAGRFGGTAQLPLMLSLPADAANPLVEVPEAAVVRDKVGDWAGGTVPPSTRHAIGGYAR